MRELKKVAVFCGASEGNSPEYLNFARELGEEMVRRRIGLVYGGGNVGLMGAIAQTVYDGLGPQHVVGIIPKSLAPREVTFLIRSYFSYRIQLYACHYLSLSTECI